MAKKLANAIIFSQNSSTSRVIKYASELQSKLPLVLLSTHRLFPTEQDEIAQKLKNPTFITFEDLLSDKEMANIDTISYKQEQQQPGRSSLSRYYKLIKINKNLTVRNNLSGLYNLKQGYILNNDLGIHAKSWATDSNFKCSFPKIRPATKSQTSLPDLFQLIAKPELWLLEDQNNNRYMFVGSISRIKSKLTPSSVVCNLFTQPGVFIHIVSSFLRFIPKWLFIKFKQGKQNLTLSSLWKAELNWIGAKYQVNHLATSIHEYSNINSIIKNIMINEGYVVFQDGYLPDNYTSKYLNYHPGVKKFIVWDKLSSSLVKRNKLDHEISTIFHRQRILKSVINNIPLKRIIIATSGAGDWTALKNRSDDDKLILAIVKVAKHFPNIDFIYRAHPFWTRDTHTGVNSLNRLSKYLIDSNITNIRISSQSLKYSQETHNLHIPASSFSQDIKEADLVLGEHSIAMIDAAAEGKIFASVNLSNRRDLFESFSKLGFTNLTSRNEIIQYIQKLCNKKTSQPILRRHNRAVIKYNNQLPTSDNNPQPT